MGLDKGAKLHVDETRATYILDPDSNLPSSRHTLSPKFLSFSERAGWDWKGLIGQLPDSNNFFRNAMIQGRLILYCGHGGAENCFPRSEIDKLIFDKANSSNQLCKSTIVLMGCSSGKIS